MKTGKRRFVIFTGILLITAGIFIGSSFSAAASPSYLRQRDRISVSVLPAASQDAMKLSDDDVSDIADTLEAPVIWWGAQRTGIATDIRQAQADIFAVGGPFSDFHPVKMLYGSFLSRIGGEKGAIVLDSGLAWDLFGTVNTAGMEVKIQNKSYIIAGICSPDDSLPGLLSGSGVGRAYIAYDPLDDIPVSGMEVSMDKAVPGKNLQTVENAFNEKGKVVSSFLFQDITERAFLDAEVSSLPLAVFAAILTILIVITAKKTVAGMILSLREFLEKNYITDSWRNIARRIALMLLVIGSAAGLIILVWLLTDFPFFLPARYIPDSFINLDFYKELIKSETQSAIAAQSYIPAQWDLMHDAAVRIAGLMNMLALGGIAVFASGLHLLKDARDAKEEPLGGWKSSAWDLPAVWVYILLSIVLSILFCSVTGMPVSFSPGLPVILCLGLSFWAARLLYLEEIEKLIKKRKRSPAVFDNGSDIQIKNNYL